MIEGLDYRGFWFRKSFGLEKIYQKIVDDLIIQFDEKVCNELFFERESFTVLIEQEQEIIKREFDGRWFYFLECILMFPPQAHICSFCWENMKDGNIQAYWTTDFPDEELKKYLDKLQKRKEISIRRRKNRE